MLHWSTTTDSSHEEHLDEAEVKEAAGLVSAFLKALKGYRLYLPNNQILRGFVDSFYEQLRGFISRYGEVRLRVSQYQIGYGGSKVYENQTKEESLAFRLFIHGVREFTFHEGVPVTEINDFLHVIHRAFDVKASVDDLLTLLWEKDLKYITFIILDDFFEEGEFVEFEGFLDDGQRMDESGGPAQATVRPLVDRLIARVPAGSAAGETPFGDDIFELSDVERARIAVWVEEERSRDLIRDLCAVIFEILEPGLVEEESGNLLKILDQVFEALLNEGRIAPAAHILSELRGFKGEQEEGPLQDVVGQALARLDGKRIVAAVRPHIAEATVEQREALIEFLASLDASAVPPLIDILEFPDVRGVAHEVLVRIGQQSIGRLLACLSDPRPSVVNSLVRLLGQIADPRALNALEGPLFHSDPAIRTQALHSIEKIGTGAALRLISKVLDDPQQDIRVVAVRCLASLPAEQSSATLLAIARGKEFAKRSFYEKKEIVLALGDVKDKEVEDHLVRILRKRKMFRKGDFDDLRACAVKALANLGTERAMREIRARAKDRAPQVKRAVGQTLRSLAEPSSD